MFVNLWLSYRLTLLVQPSNSQLLDESGAKIGILPHGRWVKRTLKPSIQSLTFPVRARLGKCVYKNLCNTYIYILIYDSVEDISFQTLSRGG